MVLDTLTKYPRTTKDTHGCLFHDWISRGVVRRRGVGVVRRIRSVVMRKKGCGNEEEGVW